MPRLVPPLWSTSWSPGEVTVTRCEHSPECPAPGKRGGGGREGERREGLSPAPHRVLQCHHPKGQHVVSVINDH